MRGIYTHSFTVPESAIDMNRHINNLEYLRWMQDAATAHSTACGWPMSRYIEQRCSWVIRSHFVEYLRPGFAGESLTLCSWISAMADQTSPRKFLFWRNDDGQAIARAETLWVFVDGRLGRPRNIPDVLRTAFPLVEDEGAVLAWLQSGGHRPPAAHNGMTPS